MSKILGSRMPLRWLSTFLQRWQNLLESMDGCDGEQLASTVLVDYCQELVVLAGSWKIIGDIIQARSTLGKCFEVARRHLKAPFAIPTAFEDGKSRELRYVAIAAKKLLLECVAFQTSLARNKELIGRHDAPPNVQGSLTKEFWMLFRQAPLSIEIALLLAHSLMKQRHFTMVTGYSDRSAV
ncbi:Hypothetical protein PHPALM_5383 [Phytophthora palmivora]|uniref:Uncharacterized protein n=1 Tax=Phytophthora palmivora TaxID=4796 RepID=A0A2P4YHH5_9STRA|nr:Hypothetical protein PHPALM_5383 [Phytophthora palmivora]